MSLFKVAGVSTLQGKTKVRFANDLTRVKMLTKHGHTNIELLDLPKAMTKPEVVAYLKTTDLYGKFTDAINAADEKYNGATAVKVSMDSLKARAEAVKTEVEVAVNAS